MPPPERVQGDRRRELSEREAEREAEEAEIDWQASPGSSPAGDRPAPRLPFEDRRDAGMQLAAKLAALRDANVVVLGIPRGGVEVAAAVADELGAQLDVVIPKKVGAPGNSELGLGAVADGLEVLDERLIRALGVSEEYLRAEIQTEQDEVRRRAVAYRGARPPLDLADRVAVVVDDGVATGGTARAALRWARSRGARRVVLAVPVAPGETLASLAADADRVVAVATPEPFYAVGQWYRTFPQISDERVVELLSPRMTEGGE
jgi:predicted phosphoribosyltransferase